jgi:glutamate synthase domain-containing protein 2
MDYDDLSIWTLERVTERTRPRRQARPWRWLPAAKVSAEIAAIQGVAIGEDRLSPTSHSAFSTPIDMMRFIARLREFCGGNPVGFELCLGHPLEFLGLCKAIVEFIVVDGNKVGAGAAPLEFTDQPGMPLREGLALRARRADRHRREGSNSHRLLR